jgi:hypothetical protein
MINSKVNVLFEDLLAMTPDDFKEWVKEMRGEILYSWDTYGCPPRTGKNETDIVDQFNKMTTYPVSQFTHTDDLNTDETVDDVIINKARIGGEADQWFSNMMKTRINYTEKDNGYSVYDLFADDKFQDRVVRGAMRHLRRDSFYRHALSAIKHNTKYAIVDVDSGEEWLEAFFGSPSIFEGYDFGSLSMRSLAYSLQP